MNAVKDRFLYVDLLRAWAMTIMIEVHVTNAFMQPALRNELWFPVVNFINGLVAPSFIFISGFAFILSSGSRLDELRTFGYLFRKKLGRIALIFLVGYLLHVPYYSLRNIIIYARPEEMKHFYNVDVLQCTGSGLLILFLLRIFIKPDRVFHTVITVIAAAVIVLSPVAWNIDFSRYLPLPLACYFNDMHGSFFPVFPWHGFLFGGASLCMYIVNAKASGRYELFMKRAFKFSGIIAAAATAVVTWLSLQPWYSIKTSPLFFIERFAIIIFLLCLFSIYYKKRGERESLFLEIGRESLLIYWLHLQIIYRNIWDGKTLEAIVSRSFSFGESMAASLILILIMSGVAVLWGKIKKKSPVAGRKIFFTVLAGGAVKFFIF